MADHAATLATLAAVLKTCEPGDTVHLTGTGPMILTGLVFADPGVTILGDGAATVTPPAPAGWSVLTNCAGLTVKSLRLQGGIATMGSSRITFDTCEAFGTGAAATAGAGFNLRNGSAVTVKNCTVHDMANGVSHNLVDHITVDGCTFHDLFNDAIQGITLGNATITNNSFTNFRGAPLHLDCIQLIGGSATAPVKGVTITGNRYQRGDVTASPAQFIFCSDSVLGYDHLTITDNAALGCSYAGILVFRGQNSAISDNFLQGLTTPVNGAVVEPYIDTARAPGAGPNLVITNNVIAPPAAPGDLAAWTAWLHRNDPKAAVLSDADKLAAIKRAALAAQNDPLAKAVLGIIG